MASVVTRIFPQPPAPGTPMLASRPGAAIRRFLALRRSAGKMHIGLPGPDHEQIAQIIEVAARIPDHRRLAPWRFILLEGDARGDFAGRLGQIAASRPDAGPGAQAAAIALMQRAPVVVAVVSSPVEDGRTPEWEQILSVGAVCYNLLLAANASGFAGTWLTEWIAYDQEVAGLLGLSGRERVAGFIYLGTATADPQERLRPPIADRFTVWKDPQR